MRPRDYEKKMQVLLKQYRNCQTRILNFNFNIEVNRPFNTENRFFLSLLINDMSGIFIIRSITIQNPLYHSKDYFL